MASHTLPQAGIYCIRNLVSGRHYVGSGKRISHRWKSHRHLLRDGRHHSRTLQRSWNKHGEEAFSFDVLELVDDLSQLVAREQFWINALHAADPNRGFNVSPTAGNCLGVRHTSETRSKLSAQRKGRTKSPEHRKAIGDAQKGKIISEEQKRTAAENTRRYFEDHPEARERMREVGRKNGSASKGRVLSLEVRKRFKNAQKQSPKARAAAQKNVEWLRNLTPEQRARGQANATIAKRGAPHGSKRTLTFQQAEEIRALKASGTTYDELEKTFGLNRCSLFNIVKRRTYQVPTTEESNAYMPPQEPGGEGSQPLTTLTAKRSR